MAEVSCVYFQLPSGRVPVKEFIDRIHQRSQQKFFATIDLLKQFGKRIPKPHADYLGDDIYELRFIGIEGKTRILYFFYDSHKIVITNGFIKKTQKTPKKQLDLAKKRMKDYFNRIKK